jgi:hypothetical protein
VFDYPYDYTGANENSAGALITPNNSLLLPEMQGILLIFYMICSMISVRSLTPIGGADGFRAALPS